VISVAVEEILPTGRSSSFSRISSVISIAETAEAASVGP
jgi:hypothetical protein